MSDPFDAVDLPTLRREARERAVSLLYEAEMKSISAATVIDELVLAPDDLVVELVVGVADNLTQLDAQISGALDASWTIDRLAVLDRLVLRLGIYELVHRPEVPTGAVINEAVELAKYFSGPEASRFINGVLSTVAKVERSPS